MELKIELSKLLQIYWIMQFLLVMMIKKLRLKSQRFYSNRPDKFGEHSGLGLNIVKNLVELHKASIIASNRSDKKGANLEIIFPKI